MTETNTRHVQHMWELLRADLSRNAVDEIADTTVLPETLAALWWRWGAVSVDAVVDNPRTPADVITEIYRHPDHSKDAKFLLYNPSCPPDIARQIAAGHSNTPWLCAALGHLPADVIAKIAPAIYEGNVPVRDLLALRLDADEAARRRASGFVQIWLERRDAASAQLLHAEHIEILQGRGDLSAEEWVAMSCTLIGQTRQSLVRDWLRSTPANSNTCSQLIDRLIATDALRRWETARVALTLMLTIHPDELTRPALHKLDEHGLLAPLLPTMVEQTDALRQAPDLLRAALKQGGWQHCYEHTQRAIHLGDSGNHVPRLLRERRFAPAELHTLTDAQLHIVAATGGRWKQTLGELVELARTVS